MTDIFKNNTNFGLQDDISLPLVFIDGITRSGKSAFSGIIPSLTQMEHIQFSTELELIISGLSLKGVNLDYAKSFLRIYFNELSYNLYLSRNINFRANDQTGVDNYKDPKVYYDRLHVEEGSDIIKKCMDSSNFIPIQTHDLLVNLDTLELIGLNYKMLSLWRNPIENIYSWWTRGWGERYNGDPSGFTLLIKGNIELHPWYNAGFTEKISGLNPLEKCIVTAISLLERAIQSYNNSENKSMIYLFKFEDFCLNPELELKKICDFLNVSKTKFTEKALKEARFPRKLNQKEIDFKIHEIKKNAGKEYFNLIMEYQEMYKSFYNLMK